jgi:hypothetical protein
LLALAEADGILLLSCKPGPAKRTAWPRLPNWFVNSGRRRRRGSPEAQSLAMALQRLERMPGGRRILVDLLGRGRAFLHRCPAADVELVDLLGGGGFLTPLARSAMSRRVEHQSVLTEMREQNRLLRQYAAGGVVGASDTQDAAAH